MNWVLAGDDRLYKYFEGENVYQKKWSYIHGQIAIVPQPETEVFFRLSVWEASFNGITKQFAAEEVRQGSWVFALPQL